MTSIAVGSLNPVKTEAVMKGFNAFYDVGGWDISICSVNSGVSAQPMSDEEAIEGAHARAVKARCAMNTDYGVGLEGGLSEVSGRWFNSGWVVIVNDQSIGIASTLRIIVPDEIMQRVRDGFELGEACDQHFGAHNSKQHTGHHGLMTGGLLTRSDAFRDAVISALADLSFQEKMMKEAV